MWELTFNAVTCETVAHAFVAVFSHFKVYMQCFVSGIMTHPTGIVLFQGVDIFFWCTRVVCAYCAQVEFFCLLFVNVTILTISGYGNSAVMERYRSLACVAEGTVVVCNVFCNLWSFSPYESVCFVVMACIA